MVIVKLTRKEIISNGTPCEKSGKEKKGQLICAQLEFLVLVRLFGHSEVVESKKNFI